MKEFSKKQCFELLPKRAADSHKGCFGKALCVCGCEKYRGAAALSCMGALRSGAGLVTLAAEERIIQSVASRILEATFIPLPDNETLFAAAKKADVCLTGCGFEQNEKSAALVKSVIEHAGGAVVLDAGGLCAFAVSPQSLLPFAGRTIITPHAGEMARLADTDISDVIEHGALIAREYAAASGAVVVLKGHRTIVAAPDGEAYKNHTGNAGLARGGSGDVLAGIIAGLCAQGLKLFDAARCAVYLHGAAADLCAERLSMQGMLPEDILHDIHTLFIANERNK